VQAYLNGLGVRWERFSALPHGSTGENARVLHGQLVPWLKNLRGDRFHVIAHSKGGLDYQMLQYMYGDRDYQILSLSTLSTPHLGSVAADLNLLQRQKMDSYSSIAIASPDPGDWVNAYLNDVAMTVSIGQGPGLPGLNDLQTSRSYIQVFSGMRGNIANTFTIGANADLNGNGVWDEDRMYGWDCSEGDFMSSIPLVRCQLGNAWQTLRRHSSAHMVRVDTGWFGYTTLIIETTPTPALQNNDVVVTIASANPDYGMHIRNDMANHTAVKSRINVQAIVERTIGIKE
jgi:hypothetical protein